MDVCNLQNITKIDHISGGLSGRGKSDTGSELNRGGALTRCLVFLDDNLEAKALESLATEA